jgi:hypothetical protein
MKYAEDDLVSGNKTTQSTGKEMTDKSMLKGVYSPFHSLIDDEIDFRLGEKHREDESSASGATSSSARTENPRPSPRGTVQDRRRLR